MTVVNILNQPSDEHSVPKLKTPEGRADLMADIVGSFALEGMYPSDFDLELIKGYVNGSLSTRDMLEMSKGKYGG